MTGPINEMYDGARRAEMMRQAQRSQIAQSIGRSRDHERRTFLQWAWFRRQSTGVAVPEVSLKVPVPEIP